MIGTRSVPKHDRAVLFPPIRIPSIIYSTPLDRHIPYLASRLPPAPDKPVECYRKSAIAIARLPRSETYLMRDLKQVPLRQQCSHHRILGMRTNTTTGFLLSNAVQNKGVHSGSLRLSFGRRRKTRSCMGRERPVRRAGRRCVRVRPVPFEHRTGGM